jgi:hypothetical protein
MIHEMCGQHQPQGTAPPRSLLFIGLGAGAVIALVFTPEIAAYRLLLAMVAGISATATG